MVVQYEFRRTSEKLVYLFLLKSCSLKSGNRNKGEICMQGFQEAHVSKIENNSKRMCSIVANAKFFGLLRKACFSKPYYIFV